MNVPRTSFQAPRIAITVCCASLAACAGVRHAQPQHTAATAAEVPAPTVEQPAERLEPIANTATASVVEAVRPAPTVEQPAERLEPITNTATASVVEVLRPEISTAPPRAPVEDVPVTMTPPRVVAKPALVVPKPALSPVAAAPSALPSAAPSALPAVVPPAAPLDLGSLETRLRQTKAIGVFTKLALKNQVDDLLAGFRAYHKQQAAATLAELRRTYDLLMLKALALLQDGDPRLARDIVKSRAAIWSILADRKKFTESNLIAGATP
jgi:hypothetical protein